MFDDMIFIVNLYWFVYEDNSSYSVNLNIKIVNKIENAARLKF